MANNSKTSARMGRFTTLFTLTPVLAAALMGCDADIETQDREQQIQSPDQDNQDGANQSLDPELDLSNELIPQFCIVASNLEDFAAAPDPVGYTTTKRCKGTKACADLKAKCTSDYDEYVDTTKPGGVETGKCVTVHCLTEDPSGKLEQNGVDNGDEIDDLAEVDEAEADMSFDLSIADNLDPVADCSDTPKTCSGKRACRLLLKDCLRLSGGSYTNTSTFNPDGSTNVSGSCNHSC